MSAWLAGCGASTGRAPATQRHATAIDVPAGAAPRIDGVVSPGEWAGSYQLDLDAGARVHLRHDGKNLYLAVSGVPAHGFGLACVFIHEGDRVHVLHASAQIGSALYQRAGEVFEPRAKEYAWKEADVLAREELWMASTMGERDGSSQEFAIALEKLGLGADGSSAPIAMGYSYLNSDTDKDDQRMSGLLTWPVGLDDGVASVQLLGGWNPEHVRFSPDRWARLAIREGGSR